MTNDASPACADESGAPHYVVITPVRDEARYIERTIVSMCAQSFAPLQWVIVDDGSTDGTGSILDTWALRHSWIKVIHKSDRGHRVPGAGVMEAFRIGLQALDKTSWDYIVKLDGDLTFDQDFFRSAFDAFTHDRTLGIAGGTICQVVDGRLVIDSVGDPPFHVRGATKIYRRACWEDIRPLVATPGWDTIDEVKANCRGWTTRTLGDVKVIQLKPTGGADGRWRNAFKNGLANYLTGYHPLFMAAKCVKRTFGRGSATEGLALAAGFGSGYIRRLPHAADKETVRYLRTQQLARLMLRTSIYG